MRKNINKLATLVMTGALAASMSFGAFAAEASNDFELSITKNVSTDKSNKTSAPKTAFDLKVTAGPSATSKELIDTKNNNEKTTFAITPFTNEDVIKKYVKVTAADFTSVTEADSNGVYTSDFKVKVPASIFNGVPGVYSFTINEVDGKYTGVDYDNNTYVMYAFVENIDNSDTSKGVKVARVIIATENGVKIDEITNDFGADEEHNDSTHDLVIKKEVSGSAADTTYQFKFTVSISPRDGANKDENNDGVIDDGSVLAPASHQFTLTDAEGKPHTITASGSNSYFLKHNQSLKIEGLTADYDVYVTEEQADANGYKTTYALNDTAKFEDLSNLKDEKGNAINELKDENKAVKVEVKKDDALITIKNEKDYVAPTGVAMDIAPYALMMALAGGAAATFLRKKESFED